MTDEQFERICTIINIEDWFLWEFKFKEEILYCCLIAEYGRKQIHICIDLYGQEISRKAVLFDDDDYFRGN